MGTCRDISCIVLCIYQTPCGPVGEVAVSTEKRIQDDTRRENSTKALENLYTELKLLQSY